MLIQKCRAGTWLAQSPDYGKVFVCIELRVIVVSALWRRIIINAAQVFELVNNFATCEATEGDNQRQCDNRNSNPGRTFSHYAAHFMLV